MSVLATSLARVRRHADPSTTVYVRRRPHERAIAELIAHNLPPLQTKIRRRMLDELARRIAGRDGEIELFFELDEMSRLAATLLHARHAVPTLEDEHAELVKQFGRLVRAHDGLTSEAARRELLADHLRRSGASRWRWYGDRAALRRNLDIDALKERHDGERHHKLVLVELALDFIAGALDGIHAAEEPTAALALLSTSDLATFLPGCIERSQRWQTRRAAIRALGALMQGGGALANETVQQLGARLEDSSEHPWVQAAAIDVLWRVAPAVAQTITARHLHLPGSHAQHFLLRRLLLDRVHKDSAWAIRLLNELAARGNATEPTEHVRQGMAFAARRLLPDHIEALEPLAQLLVSAERAGDPSPLVRATAGRAVIEVLGDRLQHAPTEALFERSLELLRSWLEREHDPLPLQIACEELRSMVERAARVPECTTGLERLGELMPVLIELSWNDAVPAAMHEEAAATLETLDRVQNPERRALVQQIRVALQHTGVPGTCRVSVPKATSQVEVGRALAELTREDWGISASRSLGSLWLRRGDHFVTKIWRVLHELRNPAPNKRQGFRHTVGRLLTGTLRAPSGQLHEVTPTVVPGERVHIRAEGGWGRHVPSVDDATTLPFFSAKPVEIYSSFGVTRMRATGSLLHRLRSRLRLMVRYAEVAALRSTSLDSAEADERRAYLTQLRERYGIEVEIEPAPPTGAHTRRLPGRITSLLPVRAQQVSGLALVPEALSPGALPRLDDWLDTHAHYFFSLQANQQASLAAFFVGVFAVFFGDSFRRRISIERARARIPLCIGGWGTRGKSGTERIKAGLFHGLGYQVFSKTTGCEAMLIHSVPEGPSAEVFVFRPYGKATIWEQRNLLELAAALRADVFLWECMALNPKYVEILQHKWMRDDLTTLTNAYPDHEDIQGPAGINVADVISTFIPWRGIMLTSEINFLPLFREVCRRRETQMVSLGPREGELIAKELLELFPYQEHPRNIALVARMAEQLGIDRELAIVTMAQHVVPDLGVLKSYPRVRVRGRVLEFINGCSANERAGFMGNWERTGCAALASSQDPAQVVITVVNNREDRISRSEVFARILVNDTVVDRHVLIGTNLRGLLAYMRASMAVFLQGVQIVRPADLQEPEGRDRTTARLAALMGRLRIPPTVDALLDRLRTYARGCGLELRDPGPVGEACAKALASDGPLELARVQHNLEQDRTLQAAIDNGLAELEGGAPDDPPEVLGPCPRAELLAHFTRQLARSVIHARLQRQLDALFTGQSSDPIGAYETRLREAYRLLFDDMVVVVDDAKTKGDVIISTCARCVPPGTHLRIMGTQNIKGTGLDFVYRWLAVDAVVTELRILDDPDSNQRVAALERLRAFADHGVLDLGLLHRFLQRVKEPTDPAEHALVERLRAKVEPGYARKKALVEVEPTRDARAGQKKKGSLAESAAGWLEGWLDFLDGARRFHASATIMKDLVRGRISHPKAAVFMREIYAREKGGWLLALLSRKT